MRTIDGANSPGYPRGFQHRSRGSETLLVCGLIRQIIRVPLSNAALYPSATTPGRAQFDFEYFGLPAISDRRYNGSSIFDFRRVEFENVLADYEVRWNPRWASRASFSYQKDNLKMKQTGFCDIVTTPPAALFAGVPNDRAAVQAAIGRVIASPTFRYLIGTPPEHAARDRANLWTRYSFRDGGFKGAWVGGGFNYTGRKAAISNNPFLYMPNQTVFDAVVGYDWKTAGRDWSAKLTWKNITDAYNDPNIRLRGEPSRLIGSVSVRY